MKATEQYFLVVLFVVLCKVVLSEHLTFGCAYEILVCYHSMKAIEKYFPVVLFIMLCFRVDG